MAHRFNTKTGRVEPKPSASERTLRRFRTRHSIETVEDIEYYTKWEKIKAEIRERLLHKKQKE